MPNTVTTLSQRCIQLHPTIEEIVFSDEITTIPSSALYLLYECTKLKSITLGSKLTKISANTFAGVVYSLTDIYVKGNLQEATGQWTGFSKANCTVHLLGDQSEAHQNIWRAAGFTKFDLANENDAAGNPLFVYTENKDASDNVVSYNVAAADVATISGDITVPGYHNGKPVVALTDGAFNNAVNIKSLTLSENIATIPNYGVRGCTSLEKIYLPSTATNITWGHQDAGFSYSNPSSLKAIEISPDNPSYTSDKDGIVYSKDMKVLYKVPAGNGVKRYVMPNTITDLGMRFIQAHATLEEIVFSDEITKITGNMYWVLFECRKIETITFGSKFSEISGGMFGSGLSSLTDIYVKGTFSKLEGHWGDVDKPNVTVHLLSNQSEAQQALWRDKGFTKFDLANDKDSDGNLLFVFTENKDASNNVVSYKVKAADVNAISGDILVPGYYNGKPVVALDYVAFENASKITSITLSENIVSIPYNAIRRCESLERINIPSTTTDISWGTPYSGPGLGAWCNSLKSIEINPDNSTYKSDEVGAVYSKDMKTLLKFPSGNGVRRYVMPNTITALTQRSIQLNYTLEELVLSDEITTIPSDALYLFYECTNLKSITLGSKLSTINTDSFAGSVFSLTDIYVKGTLTVNKGWSGFDKSKCTVHFIGTNNSTIEHVKVWRDAGFTLIDAPGLSYTVTFNTMGGTSVPSQVVGYDSTTGNITQYAKEPTPASTFTASDGKKWNLDGWYRTTNFLNQWDFVNDKVTGNITLYAKWVNPSNSVKYTINYYVRNLGSTATPTISNSSLYKSHVGFVTIGQTTTIAPGNLPGCTAVTTTSDTFTAAAGDADRTYNFFYTRKSYTFKYDSNGGEPTTPQSKTYEFGATVTTPPTTPTKLGYSISKWIEARQVGDSTTQVPWTFGSMTMPATDVIAKVTWAPVVYKIVLSNNSKTLLSGSAVSPTDKFTVDAGSVTGSVATYTPPAKANFKTVGYTLNNWQTTANSKTNNYVAGTSLNISQLVADGAVGPSNTITLIANWTENTYTVKFANGHASATTSTKADVTLKYTTTSAYLGTIPYTNYGYTANKWGVAQGASGQFVADTTTTYTGKALIDAGANEGTDYTNPSKTITLYANWKLNTYTINYASYKVSGTDKLDANGVKLVNTPASSTISSQSLTIEDVRSATKPTITGNITSTYTGYTFSGWKGGATSTDYATSNVVDEPTFKKLFGEASGNTTNTEANLIAKWSVITYTFTFNKTDGSYVSGTTTDKTLSAPFNATITLPTSTGVNYTKQGFVLTSWMTSSGGTTVAGEVSTLGASSGQVDKSIADRTLNVWEILAKSGIAVGGTTSAPSVILYAKWEGANGISFTVNYYYERPGAPGGSSQGGTFVKGDSKTGSAKADTTVKLVDKPNGKDFLEATKSYTISGGTTHKYAIVSGTYDNGISGAVTSATQVVMSGNSANNVVNVYYKLQLGVTYKAGSNATGTNQVSSTYAEWGGSLPLLPTITEIGSSTVGIYTSNPQGYKFSYWTEAKDTSNQLSTSALSSVKLYDDSVYTANWTPIEYTLNVAYKTEETNQTGVVLPATTTYKFKYTDIQSGTNASSYTLPSVTVNRGYTFKGWLNSNNAADNTKYNPGHQINPGLYGSFLKLYPNAQNINKDNFASATTTTLFADIYKNEYTLNFYKFAVDSTTNLFDTEGISSDSPITIDSTITMPTQNQTDSSKLVGLNGSANPEDTKMLGYALSSWTSKTTYDTNFSFAPKATLSMKDILDKLYGQGLDAPITIKDGHAISSINLYAGWNLVYVATLPTDSAIADIVLNITDTTGKTKSPVKIQSAVPHTLYVTATSEVTKDITGSVKLWETVIKSDGTGVNSNTQPNSGFTFSWAGESFPINGGGATFKLNGTSSSGAVSEISSLLTLNLASGYKINPAYDESYFQSGDSLYSKRGQIAKIIWTISTSTKDGYAYQDTSTHVYTSKP